MYMDHTAQAKHNARVHALINAHTPSYLDWEITATFYTALHLIDRHLQDMGQQVHNHRSRLVAVRHHLPSMYGPYNRLYSLSVKARYGGIGIVNSKSVRTARRAYEQLATAGDPRLDPHPDSARRA